MARKILLADDSVTAQNMGRKILTDAGYDVITVNNGSAALKRVAEQKPDLIVLDVYMPGYSGLEVCVRLKDAPETARIPILLTVGKLEPFKPDEATRVRADGFIVKPFEASELLSALTRLEDRVVPSQSDGSRFSTQVSGLERFNADPSVKRSEGGDDSDTGWKNRLRFPKKKKDEPEPEPEPDFVTPSSFRDYRRGGGKAPAGTAPFPLSANSSASQEPGLVPDIPRDITPEELDALSELVAKLDGVPAAENVAAISEKIGPVVAPPTEAPKESTPEGVASETRIEAEVAAAPAEIKQESDAAPAGSEANAIKADVVETPSVASSAETPSPSAEVESRETAAPDPVTYKTEAAVAQDSAPIDKSDEPMFASPVNSSPEVQVEAASISENAPVGDLPEAEAHPVESKSEIAQPEEPKAQETQQVEEVPQPEQIAARPQEAPSSGGSSPSAEELAEALRFLTPSPSPAAPQTLAEAGAVLASELSRSVGGGSRWIAESVALSPDEASGSLEAEMFRTFATSTDGQTASHNETSASDSVTEATSKMHVEAAMTANGQDSTRVATPAESSSSSQGSETGQTNLPAKQAEDAPEEQVASMTFADAGRSEESESVSASAETVNNEATEAQHEDISKLENGPGGEDAMGKETKGKGGKSNWHQIRSGAPSAEINAVEAAKQDEEPKSMAAAASADNGANASHIASIVDSVLADLRPKIVEEIAKQLAKK